MAEIRKVPAIRFKGFSEDWEGKQIADVCSDTTGGGTPKTTESKYWNGGIPWLQSSDLVENQLSNVIYRKTITEYGLKSSATKLVPADSIAIITRVGVGKLALIPYEYSTSQDFLSLSYLKVDKWFGAYSIWKKIQSELHAVQGTSIKGITKEELLSKRTLIAKEINEQTQIGNYFQHLDKLINLHQSKVNKLTNLKKAMLEKMFPKQGAAVPEIRFKGFTMAWEPKEINALADRYDNLRIPVTSANRTPGPVPYYGANGIQDYVDGYTHEGEFILIAEDGANDLKNYPVQYVNGKIWVNNHAHVLQGKGKIASNLFLKCAFSQVNIEPFLVGGGRAKLNAETMMKIEMPVPKSFDEQKKIGAYFQNLDKCITLHQKELKKLNNIKKACLEKMFV